jgi:secreted trypsin-like serine protease
MMLGACGEAPQETGTLKITNGRVIEESQRPEVVNLYRRVYQNGKLKGGATCTGTWIGENTILTAAHCTGDGPSETDGKVPGVEIMVFEVIDHTTTPKKTRLITPVVEVYRNSKWDAKKGFNRYDLAILKTAPQKSGERQRGLAKIGTEKPQKGDVIELVGYGYYDMSPFGKKGDDLKRVGTNTIAGIQNGFLNITGEIKNKNGGATGEHVSAGQGDSGGPMFHDGKLIGVASGGGSGGIFAKGEASYVDLNSEESQAFLARFGY